MGRLEGKTAAITGAGGGIGKAAAELFAAEGAVVVVLETDEKPGRSVADSINDSGGRALFIQTDISDEKSVIAAFSVIEESLGRLDVLYNNASVFLGGSDASVTKLSTTVWHKILSVNLNGLFYCCKYGIPLLINSGGGAVINTSSSAGVIGIPKCDAYTATKGATISLTKSMAVEYGPHNVRVNCIAPAAIATPMVLESNFKDPEFDEQRFLATTPLRKWGQPEDIAGIALFLASDEASYLNGAVIVADGGITVV
ncbi:MAG: SDR family NAD(P)-dependent oxidoreductase [bacterium]|nr:SDR family NAD(P)-dependent oxidoreductase [bacterium]